MENLTNKKFQAFREKYFYDTLSSLSGNILEVGFGNGSSLLKYRNSDKVYAIEADENIVKQAREMLIRNNVTNVFPTVGSVERLDFKDNFFDYISCAFTLCSVQNQKTSIQEIYRVLKPDGKFIAIEHTLSRNKIFSLLQRLLTRPISRCCNNCHLNNDPLKILANVDFKIIKTHYLSFFIEPPLYIEAVKR